MSHPTRWSLLAPALVGLASAMMHGCESGSTTSRGRGGVLASVAAPPISPVRPVALANGEAIMPSDLETRLRERAGVEVLEEIVLETALREVLRERGMQVTQAQCTAEESLFLELLGGDGSAVVVSEFRSRRGLGEVRWKALLWRNAALRALTAPDVRVPEGAVEQLHAIRHGERRVVRLIAVRTPEELSGVRDALEAGDRFESVALAMSIDPSASLGGLIGPVSRADPALPAALREAVSSLDTGAMTQPILLPGSIVLARVERVLPPDGTALDQVREALSREALLRAQRSAMDAMAARLRAGSRVTVIDPTLSER